MTELELSRRERKKEETKERIFKVAVKLFRDKGFEATTIDDITERADVAKGTFFNYFPRKEAVLGYLTEAQLAEAEVFAADLHAARKPARLKLVELLHRIASVYEDDPDLSQYVMRESMKRAHTPTDAVHIHWHELLTRLFSQGQETGEFRRDVDPSRAVYVIGSVYMGTVFMWLCCQPGAAGCEGMSFGLREELAARLALVLDGLAANG